MARKKIIPEEKVPETAVVDETEVTDTGEAVQSGPPPNADALGAGVEAPIARGTGRKTAKKAAGEELPTESGEEITAEETPDAADEDLAGADDSALSESSAISAALESVLDAYIEGAERSAADTDLSDVNMTPGRLPELHEATSELPSYSIDLSEEPEAVPAKNDTLPDAEEDDWGFREPRREVPEEEAPAQPTSIVLPVRPAPSVPSVQSGRTKAAVKSDRQLFFELKFNELDRGLTPEERQEWNSIYASYRGRSALTGTIIGVDPRSIYVWNPKTERREKLTMYCAIVVPYRVRIMIPETEMWEEGEERPDYVLQNMVGAKIDFIIIKVEREAGFAVGSRRLASRSQRYFFAHREDLHSIGARVKCQLIRFPRLLQGAESALVGGVALGLHLHLGLNIAAGVLLFRFFECFQKFTGTLDGLLHGNDRGTLGVLDLLANTAVFHAPGNALALLQIGEVLRFADTKLFKGHRGVLDVLLHALVIEYRRLLQKSLLGIFCRFLLKSRGDGVSCGRIRLRLCRSGSFLRRGNSWHRCGCFHSGRRRHFLRRRCRCGCCGSRLYLKGVALIGCIRAVSENRVNIQSFLGRDLGEGPCVGTVEFAHKMLAPFDFETKKDRNRPYEQLRFHSCPLLSSSSFESDGGRNDPLSVAVPP